MRLFPLIFLCLFLPIMGFSQATAFFDKVYKPNKDLVDSVVSYIPLEDGKVVYRAYLPHHGDIEQVYSTLKRWFVDSFPDIQNTIQIDDRQGGLLVGKSVKKYNFKSGVNSSAFAMYFTISLKINADVIDMAVYNIYGSDKRTNNLHMYLDATNALLNDTNFDQHNATNQFNVDLTKSYFDYLKGKKKKYNGNVVYTVNQEVQEIIDSAKKTVL